MSEINVRELGTEELFTIDFMREHTQWNSFDGMTDMCGEVTAADYGVVASPKWNEFVSGNTSWYSWQEMRDAAVRFYMDNHA